MPRFPYVNFPFQFYKNPIRNPAGFPTFPEPSLPTKPSAHCNSNHSLNNIVPAKNTPHEDSNCEILGQKNKSNKNNMDYLFDLFGLKIYSDDVLIVSLIYFLYSENVKDDGLFIVLVLLLLS